MRCLGSCPPSYSLLGSSRFMDDPPPREGENPGSLSTYRRFWAGGSAWERLLLPPWQEGPAMARTEAKPAVYEFGVSMPQAPTTIVPVYVGQSVDVRRRHQDYVRDGSHIKEWLSGMLLKGYTVWQRLRYLDNVRQTQRWESLFLVDYDYAWNADLNPPKREVELEHRDCCCVAVGIDVVTFSGGSDERRRPRVSMLAKPLQACTFGAWTASLVLQMLCAITAIAIVAARLDTRRVGDASTPGATQVTSDCLLGVDSHGNSLCVYSYIVSSSNLLGALLLAIFAERAIQRGKRCWGMLEGFIAACMAMWCGIGGIVLTRYAEQADNAGTPKSDWRNSVYILFWVETGLWGLCFLVKAMVGMLRCCASKSRPTEQPSSPTTSDVLPPPTAPTWPDHPEQQFMAETPNYNRMAQHHLDKNGIAY